MRLTLRTLLAYMDGVLEPADHEELAKRIDASDVARELLHRVRDAVRRPGLPAPPMDPASPAFDANAVAEYLDNTLSPEEVTAFELKCLDLDPRTDAESHLAEVAACHHILMMVLGEAAEVDPHTRRLLYDLPHRQRSLQPVTPEVLPAHPIVEGTRTPTPLADRITEVPDYLRAAEHSLARRAAPALAALALLGLTAFLAFRPGGWLNQVAREDVTTPRNEAPADDPGVVGPAPQPGGGAAAPGAGAPAPEPAETPPPGTPAEEPTADPGAPGEPTPLGPSGEGAPENGAPPAGGSPGEEEAPADPAPPAPGADESDAGGDAAPGEEPPAVADPTDAPIPPAGGDPSGTDPDPADPQESDDADADATPPAPPAGPIATVRPGPAVVLGPTDGDDPVEWRRLGAGERLAAPTQLLSLPTYRPSVSLDGGLLLDMISGTLVELDRARLASGDPAPSISVVYGKLLLTNVGGDPTRLTFEVGDARGELTLDVGASLAVSAERPFEPGADYEAAPAPIEATCYAKDGGVTWTGPALAVNAVEPSQWGFVQGKLGGVAPMAEVPPWLIDTQLPLIQRDASPSLARQLAVNQPVWQQLETVYAGARKDDKSLAALCSLHVGHFDQLVMALRDTDQQTSWKDHIDALRGAMARSPALARAIQQEMAAQRGPEDAAVLYEMLRGYRPEGVTDGVLKTLIDRLESEHTDFRVLANYNLEQITGRRGVFNPAGPPRGRDQSISRMRKRLADGLLVPTRPAGGGV